LSGGNILSRWGTPWVHGSDIRLQIYYDRMHRDDITLREARNTLDVDFQNAFRPAGRQQFVWGAGYLTSDDTASSGIQQFIPAAKTLNLVTAFVQDEIQVQPERLRLTLGSKLEHNDYSGFEAQPSARLVWLPTSNHTLVLSVAHAVRTPTRVERDYEINSLIDPRLPGFLRKIPNPTFEPERLTAYEAGYRIRPAQSLYITVSAFANHYDDLLSTNVSTPFNETVGGTSRVILPLTWANNLHGNSHGAEITADLQPARWWRFSGSYSNLNIQLTRDPNTQDLSQERTGEGNSPHHQVQIHSSVDVTERLDFDWMFRYVSKLPNLGVPAYATSDVRLAWRPVLNLELSLNGKNLHDPWHPEFSRTVEIPRSIFAQLVVQWR
jgi:iron complex outermembrane recepter protein